MEPEKEFFEEEIDEKEIEFLKNVKNLFKDVVSIFFLIITKTKVLDNVRLNIIIKKIINNKITIFNYLKIKKTINNLLNQLENSKNSKLIDIYYELKNILKGLNSIKINDNISELKYFVFKQSTQESNKEKNIKNFLKQILDFYKLLIFYYKFNDDFSSYIYLI